MKAISVMGSVALLGGVLACSGRYDVGGEGGSPSSEAGSHAGGTAAEGSGAGPGRGGFAGSAPGGGGFAGTAPGGGAVVGDMTPCEPESGPPPVEGDLVEPAVVWERVTRLIEGEGAPPPSNLPQETTDEWVSDVVTQAFGRARLQGNVEGASTWLSYWLFRKDTRSAPPLEADWANALLDDEGVLDRLLLDEVGPNRLGIFSERAWLFEKPSITARGAGILSRVLGVEVPNPPVGISEVTTPSKATTRRQELRAVVEVTAACAGCHVFMDDLGYPYGHFNELGDYEEEEDGLPIDTSGRFSTGITGADAEPVVYEFDDAQELGAQLAASCEASKGVVLSFAHAALAVEGLPREDQLVLVEAHRERLQRAFLASETRSYADLVRAYAQSPLVLQR